MEWYVTFGVQYSRHPSGDPHPLRMHKDGYAVIEAASYEEARLIASRTFGQAWAFMYSREDFIDGGMAARWHHAGELMRIHLDGTRTYAPEEKLQ